MQIFAPNLRGPAGVSLSTSAPALPARLVWGSFRVRGLWGVHSISSLPETQSRPYHRSSAALLCGAASAQHPLQSAGPSIVTDTPGDWQPLNGLTAVIAGAGPAGCTLAMHLAKAGWRVRVYERRPEPGPATSSRQRSWVLAMYPRGIRPVTAVAQVPLLQERAYKGLVVGMGKPGSKPIVLERTGVLMDRTLLATSLLDAARGQYGSRVEFSFDTALESVDLRRRMAAFRVVTSSSKNSSSSGKNSSSSSSAGLNKHREPVRAGPAADCTAAAVEAADSILSASPAATSAAADRGAEPALLEVPYDLLVGADGSSSTLRSLLAEAFPGQYDTTVLGYEDEARSGSYKSVYGLPPLPEADSWAPDSAIPACERLQGEFFFVLTGGDKGFISICRDIDGAYCGYLAISDKIFATLRTQEDYLAYLPQACPQLPAAWLPLLAEKLAQAPLSRFPQMRSVSRFWAPGGVVLVGDAAHTVTPSLGQGLNSALQDCELIVEELRCRGAGPKGPEDIDAAIQRFSESRAPDIRALQELELLQSSSLTSLSAAPRAPLPLLQLLARKWIIIQYSGLALLGTIAATAQAANRKKMSLQQQQQQAQSIHQRGGEGSSSSSGSSTAATVGSGPNAVSARPGTAGAAPAVTAGEEATARADQLATQLDATYVRSPPMYELLRGHMSYSEMLQRVYGMAALGSGLTAALVFGLYQVVGSLASRALTG